MGRPMLPRESRICQHCGVAFTEKYTGRVSQYCSATCRSTALIQHNTKHPATIDCTCAYCGIAFHGSHTKHRQGKTPRFCSASCKSRHINLLPVADRLEQYTQKSEHPDGCWEWTGHRSHGYAMLSIDGTQVRLSRWLYMQRHGAIPEGLMERHTCDNRGCVNLAHLLLGTALQNVHDKFRTNSQAKKLTPDAVRTIRTLAAGGTSQRKLAALFSVRRKTIERILAREIWAHVT